MTSRWLPDEAIIETLELTTRPYGCLKRAGFRTVGEVRAASPEELLAIPNLGVTSLAEILEVVGPLGTNSRRERREAERRAREAKKAAVKSETAARRAAMIAASGERRVEWMRKFHAGATYEEIAVEYGVTRERVRQVLMPTADDRAKSDAERDQHKRDRAAHYAEDIKKMLIEGATRSAVVKTFMVRHIDVERIASGLTDTERVYSRARRFVSDEKWSDDDIIRILREAAASRGTDTIGATAYMRLRERQAARGVDWPSAALIIKRMGWSNACERAGLRATERPRGMGLRRFSDEDIERALLRVAKILGRGPSQAEYRRLRQDGEPKDGVIRNRFGNWTQARLAANDLLAEPS